MLRVKGDGRGIRTLEEDDEEVWCRLEECLLLELWPERREDISTDEGLRAVESAQTACNVVDVDGLLFGCHSKLYNILCHHVSMCEDKLEDALNDFSNGKS